MFFGNKEFVRSPVQNQKLIWLAEYWDGTYLAEYDFQTRVANDFKMIQKDKLIKFGLVGSGVQAYFDVANGVFTINGNRIQVSYVANDMEYPLTGRTILYNDIIQYKDAVADANILSRDKSFGYMPHTITNHMIGYKKNMDLNGINIHFQNILHLPLDAQAFMQIRITSDKDMEGSLIIRFNGLISAEIDAPLKANLSGVINSEL